MYCTECGTQVHGKFCGDCGTKTAGMLADPEKASPPADWRHEMRYDVLLQRPEVRQRIHAAAATAPNRLSGEDFLKIAEKALSSFTGGAPLSKLAGIAQPVYARWGVRTGKSRQEIIAAPIGQVLVDVVVALAHQGQEVRKVQQGDEGCRLESVLPSDLWAFAGEFHVEVRKTETGTAVSASTTIPGQLFDWGKSRSWLNQFFRDVMPASDSGLSKSA